LYRNSNLSIPEIAKELGVDVLVEGSFFRAGDTLRINVQLINGVTDKHFWAKEYDRELSEILVLQSEITREIAKEIRISLTDEAIEKLGQARTIDPEVIELYFEAKFLTDKVSAEGALLAIEKLNRALEIDPEYVPLYIEAVEAYGFLIQFTNDLSYSEERDKLIDKALLLDDTYIGIHMIKGQQLITTFHFEEGAEHLRRVIELDPKAVTARVYLAQLMENFLVFDEAISLVEKAAELDPDEGWVASNVSLRYQIAGRAEEAEQIAINNSEKNPDFWISKWELASIYSETGRFEAAINNYKEAMAHMEGIEAIDILMELGYTYGIAGRDQEAMEIITQLEKWKSEGISVPSLAFTPLYIGLGDYSTAMDYFEAAYDEKNWRLIFFHSWFWKVWENPRFQAVRINLGLPIDSDQINR